MEGYQKYVKPVLAEFIGLVVVVFAICSVVTMADNGKATLTDIGLVHLFAFAFMIYAFGGISGGHFNPAVTIQFIVFKKIEIVLGIFYVVAQCLGAIIGALLAKSILTQEMLEKTNLGSNLATNGLAPGVTVWQGFLAEFAVTAILVLVIWGTAVEKGDQNFFAGWSIAAVIASGVFLIGNITGESLNPARSFGPEVVMMSFNSNSWIFWVGPITGGLFGGALYNFVFYVSPDEVKEEKEKEDVNKELVDQGSHHTAEVNI